jgi:hypothetical protein
MQLYIPKDRTLPVINKLIDKFILFHLLGKRWKPVLEHPTLHISAYFRLLSQFGASTSLKIDKVVPILN